MASGQLGRILSLLAAALIGAGGTYLAIDRQPQEPVGPTPCQELFTTVDQIHSYLADQRARGTVEVPLVGIPEADRDQAWADFLAGSEAHLEETVTGFTTQFAPKVQVLVNQMVAARAWPADEPTEVIVVNPLGIEHLATQLEVSALESGCDR